MATTRRSPNLEMHYPSARKAAARLRVLSQRSPLIACRTRLILLCWVALAACSDAGAQAYPIRPVRLVLAFAPGGTSDIVGRPLAQKMGEVLGQPCIVENRSGAGGVVAAVSVAKSPADGYTLLLSVSGFLTIMPGFTKLPYDVVNDYSPVGLVATSQFVLVVHASVPVRNVNELIALAKTKPGRLVFGSNGSGSVNHVAGELLNSMAGVSMLHVPYKGSGPMTIALLSGQIDLAFPGVSPLIPFIKAGRVKGLAVTGKVRTQALPDLPTLDETGLKGYEAINLFGILAPAKTPPDIVRRLNVALLVAMKSPELRDTYIKQGNDPTPSSSDEFAALIRSEIAKWARVVRDAGIKAE